MEFGIKACCIVGNRRFCILKAEAPTCRVQNSMNCCERLASRLSLSCGPTSFVPERCHKRPLPRYSRRGGEKLSIQTTDPSNATTASRNTWTGSVRSHPDNLRQPLVPFCSLPFRSTMWLLWCRHTHSVEVPWQVRESVSSCGWWEFGASGKMMRRAMAVPEGYKYPNTN